MSNKPLQGLPADPSAMRLALATHDLWEAEEARQRVIGDIKATTAAVGRQEEANAAFDFVRSQK